MGAPGRRIVAVRHEERDAICPVAGNGPVEQAFDDLDLRVADEQQDAAGVDAAVRQQPSSAAGESIKLRNSS